MKKTENKGLEHLILLTAIVCLLCCTFTGCERNSAFKDKITFQGYVNSGHMSSGIIIVDGPLPNVSVVCEGRPEVAKTKTDGSYTLEVKTVRKFTALDADTYTLWAFTSTGGDEKVSLTAVGKPGDTVNVRSFIINKHTEE